MANDTEKILIMTHDSVPEQVDVAIGLRPITDDDQEFLLRLYASTRAEEKALVGWPDEQWDQFLAMQFHLQHTQYMQNYRNATFDIIMHGQTPAGRFYIDRRADEFRLIDVALLPEYRCRGIASRLIRALLLESEANGLPISLHVEKNNPILDYYQRLGFRVEADREVYYFMVRPVAGNSGSD